MRVTAIHLSENTLIPDPICPPLWDICSPRHPVTVAVVHLTWPGVHCSYSLLKQPQPTSDQRPFWGTITEYNSGGSAADVCTFKSDTGPQDSYVKLFYTTENATVCSTASLRNITMITVP
ncbi:hypothetical protein EXN66_Car012845 [Channa argus]|uniref:Uncharacterized protein n=1 Tax=Channa argus TaxID=215402 RepID=A0A6G1Q3Q6_CHAAH|nr:hypothetical protein EXN66_Car012845 [Channa argus]